MNIPSDLRFEFYAITDQPSSQGRSDEDIAAALLRGGATCLQYRAKKVPARRQWDTAVALRRLCLEHRALFIVNDRVDLALDSGADGVHLGQEDLPLASARRLARSAGRSDLLLGKSTHSMDEALEAAAEGADYIGYGPLYATQTKENNVAPLGLGDLAEVLQACSVPVVAIGGIKFSQLGALAGQGARHCAVVTALTGADDVETTTREYLFRWREAKALQMTERLQR